MFVSDGSKCDSGNIQEIFSLDSKIAVVDPVYPVYVDTNVMAGRTGEIGADGRYANIVYMPATEENNFEPDFPKEKADIIYLCYPNNPTGMVATKERLTEWVNYAKKIGSIILFDSAYESFIQDKEIPKSIYEIPGAKEVAIEFRSFSKTAGFTGIRCAYLVIPKELKGKTKSGEEIRLQFTLEQKTYHKIQWCLLCNPKRCRSDLFRSREKRDSGANFLLYGECKAHQRGSFFRRI